MQVVRMGFLESDAGLHNEMTLKRRCAKFKSGKVLNLQRAEMQNFVITTQIWEFNLSKARLCISFLFFMTSTELQNTFF